MKTKVFSALFLAAATTIIFSCTKEDVNPDNDTVAASSSDAKPSKNGGGTVVIEDAKVTGNGSLSGSHYQVNIIGVPKNKSAEMTGNNGSRIFVPLEGSTRILLSEGEFGVLDANGTDGSASFQLPNPDPENDGYTTYTVFARALGTPGGSSKTTTCATDPISGLVYCSEASLVSTRTKGKQSFSNVTNELLYLYADIDGDGVTERYNLFDEALQDYFWQYDNNGLKLLQLRFYEVSTNVN